MPSSTSPCSRFGRLHRRCAIPSPFAERGRYTPSAEPPLPESTDAAPLPILRAGGPNRDAAAAQSGGRSDRVRLNSVPSARALVSRAIEARSSMYWALRNQYVKYSPRFRSAQIRGRGRCTRSRPKGRELSYSTACGNVAVASFVRGSSRGIKSRLPGIGTLQDVPLTATGCPRIVGNFLPDDRDRTGPSSRGRMWLSGPIIRLPRRLQEFMAGCEGLAGSASDRHVAWFLFRATCWTFPIRIVVHGYHDAPVASHLDSLPYASPPLVISRTVDTLSHASASDRGQDD